MSCFAHPLFDAVRAYGDLLTARDWPAIDGLANRLLLPGKHLVPQDERLLADGLHYECRIAERGQIATRAENWHDLFNALVWARYPAIKLALNACQCMHIAAMGASQRNRAQSALTQFDETGVIVRVRDASVMAAWDAHDWQGLFVQHARSWRNGDISVAAVIGHALMEQALLSGRLLVGKCVVVQGEEDAMCVDAVAQAIRHQDVLTDPLQLRPLPLAGIPGWHAPQDAGFYRQAAYFRPLRDGRVYPLPVEPPVEPTSVGCIPRGAKAADGRTSRGAGQRR